MADKQVIEKELSPNDLGFTGGHQGGILIPKQGELLAFFPKMNTSDINPRVVMYLKDDTGTSWKFSYIYYNNKFRGGTRNEYRLTGMTAYLRNSNLKVSDYLVFTKEDDQYKIAYRRKDDAVQDDSNGVIRLTLNNCWKIIDY